MIGTHSFLGALVAPELALDQTPSDLFGGKSEAAYLAECIKPVADRYAPKIINKENSDLIVLAQALLQVYGSRFYAIRERMRAQRAKPVNPPPVVRPAEPAQHQRPPQAPQAPTAEMRTGDIPGVGPVEFPPGHPLFNGGLR